VQAGAGENKQAGTSRLRRRRFLQGAVLGAAAAPLTPALAAAAAGPTEGEQPQIIGGRLVSLSQGGDLEVEDGTGRRVMQLTAATSIWKGGESLPAALRPGDDLMVKWLPGDGLALRVWSNLTRVEGVVRSAGRSRLVLRFERPNRTHYDVAVEVARDALFGDFTTQSLGGGRTVSKGMYADVIGEALPDGRVRGTLLYVHDGSAGQAAPAGPQAQAPAADGGAALATYSGNATWFACSSGAGRCGTCSTSRSDQAAWPALDTCGCCGSSCCDCSRGCKNQVYLRCGSAASVTSVCNSRTKTVYVADCGPCQRANCGGCSPDLCGRGCSDCRGYTGVVIDLTRPTFAAFGYDPAVRGCFSCTVSAGGGTRSWPVKRRGDTGEAVRTIQYLLRARGYSLAVDGIFGAETEARVKSFQQSKGLAVDGIVGNQTWEALIITVQRGSTGDAVRAVQSQLNTRGYGLAVDGVFGSATEAAVRDFQSRNGLAVDGIVGPNTWCKLVGGTIG
jgi:hypothetical protein